MDPSPADSLFAIFPVIFTIAALVVIAGIVAVIALLVRNARKVSESGHDPFTLQADLAVKAIDSSLLAPAASVEERLAELDRLFAQGTITADEKAAARAELLGGR